MGRLMKSILGVSEPRPENKRVAWLLKLMFTEIGALCKLNILFLLSCIPLVTIGPAIGALSSVTIQMICERSSQPVREYLHALRDHFGKCFGAGVAVSAVGIMLGVAAVFYWNASRGVAVLFSIFLFISILICGFFLAAAYLFPICVMTKLSLKDAIRGAWMLSLACPYHSIPAALCDGGMIVVGLMFWPLSVPLMLTLLFSTANIVISYAAWADMKKYMMPNIEAAKELDS